MIDPLTEAVLRYQSSGEGFDDLRARTAVLVYKILSTWHSADEDETSDFFCRFYPKIPSLFRRFVYRGKPFISYLIVTVKMQFKSFMSHKIKADRKRDFLEKGRVFHQPFSDPDSPPEENLLEIGTKARFVFGMDESGRIGNESFRRRLLYLAFKEAMRIDSQTVEFIASMTGYEEEWMFNCIQKLKEGMREKMDRVESLRKKRNWYFIRLCTLHREIREASNNSGRKDLLSDVMNVKRLLLETIRELSRVQVTPTHRDIARTLGIPKGSVDSGLYYLKNRYAEACEKPD